MNNYDPYQYWSEREHPNTSSEPGISPIEAEYLLQRLAHAGTLLELGPGVGRLFSLYKAIRKIHTLDLSMRYQSRARAAASSAGIFIQDHYLSSPLQKFPFDDQSFDLGIASHVLMHIPFGMIEHAMTELARCCKRVVVISATHRYWPQRGDTHDPKWHCFAHDYKALCDSIGFEYYAETSLAKRELDGAFAFEFSMGTQPL
jgi:2-polyprenyl-3-methyl-5-hydroxy-6-metoxy-1,4-benzoquinol methylase